MPKTKISEFSATPGNNTDIDGINIAEGCAPSGINDAIRELMAQLKDFQAGTAGDSFNGPIGTTTPAAGTFTNLSASGTFALTGDQVQISEGGTGQTTANAAFNALAPSQSTHAGKYLKTDGTNTSWDAIEINTADITGTLPIANGGTGLTALGTGVQTALGIAVGSSGAFVVNGGALGTPSSGTVTNLTGTASININGTVGATTPTTGAFTTLSASGNITVSGGTANGVAYLNGSKVLTTGSALTFNGSTLATSSANASFLSGSATTAGVITSGAAGSQGVIQFGSSQTTFNIQGGPDYLGMIYNAASALSHQWAIGASEQMRLTSTGLGIGTSSPGSKLDVQGGSINTSSFVTITPTTTTLNAIYRATNTGGTFYAGLDNSAGGVTGTAYAAMIWHTGAYPISFGTNNTLRATLDSSGNLGIGGTPTYRLDVFGTGPAFRIKTAAATTGFIVDQNNSDSLVSLINYENAALRFGTNASERARITSAGDVGIGTSSPIAKLTVLGAGTINAPETSTTGASIQTASYGITTRTGNLDLGATDALAANIGGSLTFSARYSGTNAAWVTGKVGAYRETATSGVASSYLAFATTTSAGDLTERARITSGGYFKASNSGAYTNSTGSYFEFYQTAAVDCLLATRTTDTAGVAVYYSNLGGGATHTNSNHFYGVNNGTIVYRIAANGNVTNTNGSYGTISDAKMKTDIVDAGSQWADIKAIRFRKFKMKDDPEQIVQLGVVAQELEQTSPGLVEEHADRDGEGNDLGTITKSVKTSVLLMKAAVALQEAMVRIEQLEAKVAALEAK